MRKYNNLTDKLVINCIFSSFVESFALHMAYTSVDGKIYKDFLEYCNSDDLELDDRFRKLLAGSRIPQNDEERAWLEDMRRLQSEGKTIDIPSDIF